MNIPLPRSYVFPQIQEEQNSCIPNINKDSGAFTDQISSGNLVSGTDEKSEILVPSSSFFHEISFFHLLQLFFQCKVCRMHDSSFFVVFNR